MSSPATALAAMRKPVRSQTRNDPLWGELEACVSRDDVLETLARAAGLPTSEPERSAALRDRFHGANIPSRARSAIVRWARNLSDPWLHRMFYGGTIIPRFDPWHHPHLVPAMLVLEPYGTEAGPAFQTVPDTALASQTAPIFHQGAPGAVFKSWQALGLPTTDELDSMTEGWSFSTHSVQDFLHVAAHPNVSPRLFDRAVDLVGRASPRWLTHIASRPGALVHEGARRALWESDLGPWSQVGELVPLTPTTEYGALVRHLSSGNRFGNLGRVLGLGTPDQHGAIQATASEITTWSVSLDTEGRSALVRAMAHITRLNRHPALPPRRHAFRVSA